MSHHCKVSFPMEHDEVADDMRALGDSLVMCSVGDSRKYLKHAVGLRSAREEQSLLWPLLRLGVVLATCHQSWV